MKIGTELKRKHIGHKYLYYCLTGHHGLEHQAVTHAVTDWCPPNLSIPTLARCSMPYCGSFGGSSTTRLWVVHPTTNSSNPPFFPAVGVRHVNIQIPHMREGMISHRTPSYPAKVGTFPIRVSTTIWLVL